MVSSQSGVGDSKYVVSRDPFKATNYRSRDTAQALCQFHCQYTLCIHFHYVAVSCPSPARQPVSLLLGPEQAVTRARPEQDRNGRII